MKGTQVHRRVQS